MSFTTVEAVLIDKLINTAAVAGLVTANGKVNIYVGEVMQGINTGAISMQLISRQRVQAFGASTNLVKSLFQFSCWGGSGVSISGAKAIAQAVVGVFTPVSGPRYRDATGASGVVIQDILPSDERESFDSDVEAWRVQLDYDVWHQQS